jgi:hypothetical protein
MQAYSGPTAYYGELHNHCDISYGRGNVEDAFLSAREQLDFCSVTGHALWPDVPEPDDSIQDIAENCMDRYNQSPFETYHGIVRRRNSDSWRKVEQVTLRRRLGRW